MEIEYLCFTVPSLDSSDDIITEGDDENTIWIKTKDKELREKAEKNKICIIFDRITKKFYKEGEEFDIQNYRENFKGIFIKTAIKSNICHVLKYFGTLDIDGQKLFFTKPPLFRIMEDDMIFLSETFENIEDKENDM